MKAILTSIKWQSPSIYSLDVATLPSLNPRNSSSGLSLMSLKPQTPQKRLRDRFLNIFRSRSPTSYPSSISTQSPVPDDLTDYQSLSEYTISQLPAQIDQPILGSCSTPGRPPPPIIVPVNHQKTGNIGETAIQVVKESLKVVARMSDVFPPLKTAATGLVEIFDRIDVSLLYSNFINMI